MLGRDLDYSIKVLGAQEMPITVRVDGKSFMIFGIFINKEGSVPVLELDTAPPRQSGGPFEA